MHRLLVFVSILLMMSAPLAHAQGDDPSVLQLGDTVTGDISTRNFEDIYTFEGQAGMVIDIRMAYTSGNLDPLLYLTTLDNEILAKNDDLFNLDAGLVTVLPATQTYQIVATRHAERAGWSVGGYTLSLSEITPLALDEVVEGVVINRQAPPIHAFVPSQSGGYVVDYVRTFGLMYPVLTISEIDEGYVMEVARLYGLELRQGQIGLTLKPNTVYLISFAVDYYGYEDSPNASATYRLSVGAIE